MPNGLSRSKPSNGKIKSEKDIILFIGTVSSAILESVKQLEKELGQKFRPFLLTSLKRKIQPKIQGLLSQIVRCQIDEIELIEKALVDYHNQIAITICKYEAPMPLYARVVELFPYLKNPSSRSILIANDKLEMRKAFKRYYPQITPKFIRVKKYTEVTIKKIIERVGFPCVIKPTNLSKSKLVINCYYKEELEKNLKDAFRKINTLYKKDFAETEPKIIVEELMEGQMYSIDAYVNSYGRIYNTPIIEIKTGKDAGYDDLFMYTQITPSVLVKEEELKAQDVVAKAIHAVGLRSCTVHCELMKTPKGWKVIELACRTGGFREELLYYSFGLCHNLNDLLIHLGKKPVLKKTKNLQTVFMKFWPHKSGKIVAIKGLKKAQELKSLVKFRQEKRVGDYAGLSKHGHTFVVGFTLNAKTRSELLADIRKLEKWIIIKTVKREQ
ncbi:MAG: ATP-grasp domain-containing protein [Patescibacteria group bacterium]